MGDIYRHDINLKDKQSITMFSKRSTPYNKAELARLLYMQGYRDQTTGLRVNTSSTPVVLYDSTGSNTDGAMTQKATTDALLDLASTIPTNASFTLAGLSEKSYNSLTDKPNIPEGAKLYDTYGSNTDGAMTQKATTQFVNQSMQDVVLVSEPQRITGAKNFLGGITKNAVDLATVNDVTTALDTAKAQWLLDMNPIGTIIENNTGTNPSTYIGGTWDLYGQGRVTVCIDSNDLSFDTAGETGGSKALHRHTHTATFSGNAITGQHSPIPEGKSTAWANGCFSVPANATTFGGIYQNAKGDGRPVTFNATPSGTITVDSAGTGDQANLQPYIVVYRWIRIA